VGWEKAKGRGGSRMFYYGMKESEKEVIELRGLRQRGDNGKSTKGGAAGGVGSEFLWRETKL